MRKIKRSFSKLYAQNFTTGDVAYFSDRIHIPDGTRYERGINRVFIAYHRLVSRRFSDEKLIKITFPIGIWLCHDRKIPIAKQPQSKPRTTPMITGWKKKNTVHSKILSKCIANKFETEIIMMKKKCSIHGIK